MIKNEEHNPENEYGVMGKKSLNKSRNSSLKKSKTGSLPKVVTKFSSKVFILYLLAQNTFSKSKQRYKNSQKNQLAITAGPKLSKVNPNLVKSTSKIAAKTSNVFAPKLNKDLPVSPRLNKPSRNQMLGQSKKSLQILDKK